MYFHRLVASVLHICKAYGYRLVPSKCRLAASVAHILTRTGTSDTNRHVYSDNLEAVLLTWRSRVRILAHGGSPLSPASPY